MLLLTIVYNKERDRIMQGIREIKEYFKHKDILIGIYESIECSTHFLKIFCDREFNDKLNNIFDIHVASIIYNIIIDEFCKKDMGAFLSDTYFFLKYEELEEIKKESLKVLRGEMEIRDEDSIYCINKRNDIIDKICGCIDENREINIEGFMTFRMKELLDDLETIIDRVVEKYMAEKEYNEFIKLLKYFIEIQESKMDYLSIIISNDGKYIINNEREEDITDSFFKDLTELKYNANTDLDDILISALITNSPENIVIHCVENCKNKELIDTIKNVFTHRVKFCDDCKICRLIKNNLNRV
ncbi:putative sporulation protein YtxC [Clostridium sp. BJN0013]|uniref:putative sporulation protein YtxC n=1 Tax=Clostridium sp. BJN0013 TaxID=3236840 RepID=UPI0034C675AA